MDSLPSYYNVRDDNKEVVKRFHELATKTLCPFAITCRAWCGPKWGTSATPLENILNALPDLNLFCNRLFVDELDLFVFEIEGEELVGDLEKLATFINLLLHTLHNADPTSVGALVDGIASMDWDFSYSGFKFFVPAFAPFYPPSHPRYSNHHTSAFVLFQADHSFSRRGISSKGRNRSALSKRVHRVFLAHGSPYDLELTTQHPKAERYVKPLDGTQEPVRWWETDIKAFVASDNQKGSEGVGEVHD